MRNILEKIVDTLFDMGNILATIGAAIVIGLSIYWFQIRPDYNWAADINKKTNKENWVEVTRLRMSFLSELRCSLWTFML